MVTTELGTGTSFVNKNNETGFVVEPNNSKALTGAINTLFNNDELRLKMGEAANRRIQDIFSEEKLGHKYVEIYKDLE